MLGVRACTPTTTGATLLIGFPERGPLYEEYGPSDGADAQGHERRARSAWIPLGQRYPWRLDPVPRCTSSTRLYHDDPRVMRALAEGDRIARQRPSRTLIIETMKLCRQRSTRQLRAQLLLRRRRRSTGDHAHVVATPGRRLFGKFHIDEAVRQAHQPSSNLMAFSSARDIARPTRPSSPVTARVERLRSSSNPRISIRDLGAPVGAETYERTATESPEGNSGRVVDLRYKGKGIAVGMLDTHVEQRNWDEMQRHAASGRTTRPSAGLDDQSAPPLTGGIPGLLKPPEREIDLSVWHA